MNADSDAKISTARIDLRREPDFRLGLMRVRPSLREVSGEGWKERLEPKVLQVLVALVRANGEVVTKDELFESCWDGRIVVEDSLHRCIAKLRRLAELHGKGAFRIETVPRAGYRLVRSDPSPFDPDSLPQSGATPSRRGSVVVAAIALIATLSAIGWALLPARPGDWRIIETEPLISTPLIERHPAISPDGKKIAYSAGTDIFTRQIYVRNISGGDSVLLTADHGDDVSPAWSPDGKKIAYTSFNPGVSCRLLVLSLAGGRPHEVGRCRVLERSHVVWAPEGDAILFQDSATADSPTQIMRLDLATDMRMAVSHPPRDSQGDLDVAVSPDRKSIAYMRYSDRADDLIVQNLRSGAEKVVVRNQSWGQGLAWADDSQSLFIDTNFGGDHAVWSVPLDGRAMRRLTSSPIILGRLASGPHGLLAAETASVPFELAIAPIRAGENPKLIDPSHEFTWSPAYAPDGTLAFVSNRSGSMSIWTMRAGGQPREFASFGRHYIYSLSWSPDGAKLAFVIAPNPDSLCVRVVATSGAVLRNIPVGGSRVGAPAWDDRDQSLIVPVMDAHGWRLWRATLNNSNAIAPASAYGWRTVQIRDGVLYAAKSEEPGVWRLNGDQEASLVARGMKAERIQLAMAPVRGVSWLIDRNEIVYLENSDSPAPSVVSQPIGGGPSKVIGVATGYHQGDGFAVNPLTGLVTYVLAGNDDSDIVLMRLAR